MAPQKMSDKLPACHIFDFPSFRESTGWPGLYIDDSSGKNGASSRVSRFFMLSVRAQSDGLRRIALDQNLRAGSILIACVRLVIGGSAFDLSRYFGSALFGQFHDQ
jgi:hypothetical protein